MLRRHRTWVRLEELVQHLQQRQYMLLVAAVLRLPDIIDNHVPDFFSSMQSSRRALYNLEA